MKFYNSRSGNDWRVYAFVVIGILLVVTLLGGCSSYPGAAERSSVRLLDRIERCKLGGGIPVVEYSLSGKPWAYRGCMAR